MTLPNFLLSSSGEGLALRWKSFATGILPLLLLILPRLGVNVLPSDADTLIQLGYDLIVDGALVLSVIFHIIGWSRAVLMKQNRAGKHSPQFPR